SADRHAHPGAVDDTAEDVTSELVGPEEMRAARALRGHERLGERIVRCDERREDRHDEPRDRDHASGDGEWLPPGRARSSATSTSARPEGKSAHLTRILGSIRP